MYNKHPERGDIMEIEKLHSIAIFGEKLEKLGLSTNNIKIYLEIPEEFLIKIEQIYFNEDLTIEEKIAFQEEIESSFLEQNIIDINPNFIVTLSICSRLANKKAELHRNEKAIVQTEEVIENIEDKQRRLK